MLRRLSLTNRLVLVLFLVQLITTAVALTALRSSVHRGQEAGRRYAPLVDATMEIKALSTTAHLWYEELMSGAEDIRIDTVWSLLDEALWYADAILTGASNEEGTFLATRDAQVRSAAQQARGRLQHFRELAERSR